MNPGSPRKGTHPVPVSAKKPAATQLPTPQSSEKSDSDKLVFGQELIKGAFSAHNRPKNEIVAFSTFLASPVGRAASMSAFHHQPVVKVETRIDGSVRIIVETRDQTFTNDASQRGVVAPEETIQNHTSTNTTTTTTTTTTEKKPHVEQLKQKFGQPTRVIIGDRRITRSPEQKFLSLEPTSASTEAKTKRRASGTAPGTWQRGEPGKNRADAATKLTDIYRVQNPYAKPTEGLDPSKELKLENITEITTLKSGAVFDVAGKDGTHVIIKIEGVQGPQNAARERINYAVARAVLRGAAVAEPLTDDERELLQSLDQDVTPAELRKVRELQPSAKKLPTRLAGIDGRLPNAKNLAFRVQKLQVGRTLEDCVNDGKLPHGFPTPETLRQLGRMAVFDRLMNNVDRFRPHEDKKKGGILLNLANIDFDSTETTLVPVDNFASDGGHPPTEYGSGQVKPQSSSTSHHDIRNKASREAYAKAALEDIYKQTGMRPTDVEKKEYWDHFIAGMQDAVGELVKLREQFSKPGPISGEPGSEEAEASRMYKENMLRRMYEIKAEHLK